MTGYSEYYLLIFKIAIKNVCLIGLNSKRRRIKTLKVRKKQNIV